MSLGTTLALVAVLGLGIGAQEWRVEHVKAHLAEVQSDLEIQTRNVGALTKSIDAQDASLLALKTAQDTDAAALAIAEASARQVAAIDLSKAADLAVYTPKGPDFCAQLVDLDKEINPS
jgi:hypothetical protein